MKNIRYGVVNEKDREKFEKTWYLPYGYSLLTYDEKKAITYARKMKNPNVIVEKIFDTISGNNFREEIFRSGDKI